jgi:hypothetical protein
MDTPILYRTADGRRHRARLTTEHPQSSYGRPVLVTGGSPLGTADLAFNSMYILAKDNPKASEALRKAGYDVVG